MNSKGIKMRLGTALLAVILLAACSDNSGVQSTVTEEAADTATAEAAQTAATGREGAETAAEISGTFLVTEDMVSYEEEDQYSDWEGSGPSYIQLQGDTAALQGEGAVMMGGRITIALPGTYVVSGQLNDGQIVVDLESDGLVRIVLNGAEINSSTSAPIYVKQADKTVISLPPGTSNRLTDGENYVLDDAEEGEPNAAVFSKDDLTINGSGALIVEGRYNNGIVGKDDLKITGGTLVIHAVDDGIVGRDVLAVTEADIEINAGGDGMKSTNDKDADKGFVLLEGGTYRVIAGADGIQAETSVLVTGGEYTLITGGGSVNSSKQADAGQWGGDRGQAGIMKPQDQPAQQSTQVQQSTQAQTSTTDSTSAKAIKAASDITISGGSFIMDSADDAVHSNGTAHITDGTLTITSGDDGIHADSQVIIAGGRTIITKSYEGIEGKLVSMTGGEVHVTASDDGVNVAGGKDGSSQNGRTGQNSFSSTGDAALYLSGGSLTVDAGGDGLDANGSMYMSGGTVIVNGPTNSGNGALDYDGVFEVSGGTLIAAGSSGMTQAPSEASSQYSVLMTFTQVQPAGTITHVQNAGGDTVMTFAPSKDYQSIMISSPELSKDETYMIYTGGSASGNAASGLYADGSYEPGTEVVSFSISKPVTYMSETGETEARAAGPGGGGFGGGRGGGAGMGRPRSGAPAEPAIPAAPSGG
ncbi:carbohydrate-binding domain-containing protein [Paenibacillus tarimensis]|uniref:carbohydrate-binding domain-containing protein n=1 Tax=Paenibacillus tarimensis TaxID=416012 RepID=UPI001F39011C|nr:carbohydrate-binding domain-containing protein [Paenibacillus tarimensis]MCF2945596.1 carbohydrate-binding domain-containing protein [Paenibacillus tarimensis]